MNIGKEIVNFRKERGLTQEVFGDLFHVTRQTVSNWENEKSYPDIKTLIAISDYMNISLDRLLKEDKEMVSTIDKRIKAAFIYKKIIVGIGSLLILLLLVFIGYCTFWNMRKEKLEAKFINGCEESRFRYSNITGTYTYKKDNILYILPNQKMPGILDFSWEFYAKQIDGTMVKEDGIIEIRYFDGKYLGINFNNTNNGYVKLVDDLYDINSMSTEEQKIYKNNLDEIEKIEKSLIKYYNKVY